jgi:hypothetical protein
MCSGGLGTASQYKNIGVNADLYNHSYEVFEGFLALTQKMLNFDI